MNRNVLSTSDESTIVDIVRHDEKVQAVYLLGSAARGAMRADSDVDIALLLAHRRAETTERLSPLRTELSIRLRREVDLGVVSSDNLVYARQAILTGRRLFTRSVNLVETREATLLGLYARFNEDRREVLDAYRIG